MPYMESQIFRKKGVRRYLTLTLDEGDSILDCIKSAMSEHGIQEVKVEGAEGRVLEAVINFFEHNRFKSANLKDRELMIVSGNFKLSYGELFGTFKLATSDKPPMQGTLVKGKAKQGLAISLSFMEYLEKEPAKTEMGPAKTETN